LYQELDSLEFEYGKLKIAEFVKCNDELASDNPYAVTDFGDSEPSLFPTKSEAHRYSAALQKSKNTDGTNPFFNGFIHSSVINVGKACGDDLLLVDGLSAETHNWTVHADNIEATDIRPRIKASITAYVDRKGDRVAFEPAQPIVMVVDTGGCVEFGFCVDRTVKMMLLSKNCAQTGSNTHEIKNGDKVTIVKSLMLYMSLNGEEILTDANVIDRISNVFGVLSFNRLGEVFAFEAGTGRWSFGSKK